MTGCVVQGHIFEPIHWKRNVSFFKHYVQVYLFVYVWKLTYI